VTQYVIRDLNSISLVYQKAKSDLITLIINPFMWKNELVYEKYVGIFPGLVNIASMEIPDMLDCMHRQFSISQTCQTYQSCTVLMCSILNAQRIHWTYYACLPVWERTKKR